MGPCLRAAGRLEFSADEEAGEEKRYPGRQEIEGEIEELPAVPGDPKGIERQIINQQIGADGRQAEAEAESSRRPAAAGDAQDGAARPRAEQGQADRHKGEMIELLHGEQPQEGDLQQERGRRKEGDCGVGTHRLPCRSSWRPAEIRQEYDHDATFSFRG